ncbi:MAG: DUF2851 family protein [Calditrichaeota bacterium]|nr:DUF2851 family protein [Calditrichota bacterium]
MKVDDRSGIAEHFIFQLWEKKYFSTRKLQTANGTPVTVVSPGTRNHDAGPDFKNATIKMNDRILHGDVEIHRAPEDWYQHGHHADAAYNNVIAHVIIGKQTSHEPAVRLSRTPVPAEIFVDIPEEKFFELEKKYQLLAAGESEPIICQLSEFSDEKKLAVIDYFSRERFNAKVERFREMREFAAWNQILYSGILEALGYAKNQTPFRKLANRLPFEALLREKNQVNSSNLLTHVQGLLFGTAGLLPSQNPSFDWRKIKDQTTKNYVTLLEKIWADFSQRLGLEPLRREEWLFFRLRPVNFPTRRIAGASVILLRFFESGVLEKLLRLFDSLQEKPRELTNELVRLFICQTRGYWAKFYTFSDSVGDSESEKDVTLVGASRAREIVVNIILPAVFAYAVEIDDSHLKTIGKQVYYEFPRTTPNAIERRMLSLLFGKEKKSGEFITTAAKQQGLIHLYKLFCRRNECDRCLQSLPDDENE